MPATEPANRGRRAAELLVDPVGDQDLIGVGRPSSRVLVPGHHLGAIALADALDQGPPLDKLLGRGRWRLDRRGRRLAHAASVSAIHPLVLSNSAQYADAVQPDVSAAAKRRSAYLGAVPHSCY